tara:strand:- start:1272 stop:2369 length:1098 start_codon:yes stop_codon:yes gene_type:complete
MKKIADSKKSTAISLAKRRHQLSLRRKGAVYDQTKRIQKTNSVFGIPIIEAPNMLCIYVDDGDIDRFESTIEFLRRIKALKSGEKYYLSFKNTKLIEAAAILLVYSAIEEAIKENDCSLHYIPPDAPHARKLLKSKNIPKLLSNSKIEYFLSKYENLPIISGQSNSYTDEVVDHIKERVFEDELDPEKESIFGSAVTETVDNVDLHAYPESVNGSKPWWLVCSVIDKQLFLAIYDKGVGIPETIRGKQDLLARIRNSLPYFKHRGKISSEMSESEALEILREPGSLSDAESVMLSMMSDVSSTHQDKHGQGSKSIKALVDDNEQGKLWIFSNKGLLVKESAKAGNLIELPSSIDGTLIQWNIKLE